jgi:hypothetical protein
MTCNMKSLRRLLKICIIAKYVFFSSDMQMGRIITLNQYFTIGTRSLKERKLKKESGNLI